MNTIYFTVTNDLSYDQRMHRICGSLAKAGYHVTLVGRQLPGSLPLKKEIFHQKRLRCFFNKGMLFYAEYNVRLFWFLLHSRMNAVCAIDLDTILPCLAISLIKKTKRIYDAHEYFTELKEVRTRPVIKKIWLAIERLCVPRFPFGYTVSNGLADAFYTKYQCKYEVIRNLPVLMDNDISTNKEKLLIYQGAVNEARGFEQLIPAMQHIPYRLMICGDGNFMSQLKALIARYNVADKIMLTGMLLPEELRKLAKNATLGIALAEKEGLNQYRALPNKFFEYMHAGLPQVAMDFPEYQLINNQYKVAVLIPSLEIPMIIKVINETMENEELMNMMKLNCSKARNIFCWQQEEEKLLQFYSKALPIE